MPGFGDQGRIVNQKQQVGFVSDFRTESFMSRTWESSLADCDKVLFAVVGMATGHAHWMRRIATLDFVGESQRATEQVEPMEMSNRTTRKHDLKYMDTSRQSKGTESRTDVSIFRPNLGPAFVRALPYLLLPQGVTCRRRSYLTHIAPM